MPDRVPLGCKMLVHNYSLAFLVFRVRYGFPRLISNFPFPQQSSPARSVVVHRPFSSPETISSISSVDGKLVTAFWFHPSHGLVHDVTQLSLHCISSPSPFSPAYLLSNQYLLKLNQCRLNRTMKNE